jgi:hypothetical protein
MSQRQVVSAESEIAFAEHCKHELMPSAEATERSAQGLHPVDEGPENFPVLQAVHAVCPYAP